MHIPDFITALLLTLVIEGILAFILLRKKRYGVFVVIALNCITNPLMNLFIDRILLVHYVIGLIAVEILVTIIEGIALTIYLKDWKKAFLVSVIINGSSLLIGLWLMPLLY
ncbi:MAG: hypothetical protein U1C51_03215 [Candidatus Izemoplasmatales bacterium]|nr:hypothetical protein [bacterium]MDZ4196243.1 hypothetical protein [Candidatus Izemoplasmatales bacterium]